LWENYYGIAIYVSDMLSYFVDVILGSKPGRIIDYSEAVCNSFSLPMWIIWNSKERLITEYMRACN
jgi:hypothetical protein